MVKSLVAVVEGMGVDSVRRADAAPCRNAVLGLGSRRHYRERQLALAGAH